MDTIYRGERFDKNHDNFAPGVLRWRAPRSDPSRTDAEKQRIATRSDPTRLLDHGSTSSKPGCGKDCETIPPPFGVLPGRAPAARTDPSLRKAVWRYRTQKSARARSFPLRKRFLLHVKPAPHPAANRFRRVWIDSEPSRAIPTRSALPAMKFHDLGPYGIGHEIEILLWAGILASSHKCDGRTV